MTHAEYQEARQFGTTGLTVSPICLGSSGWGRLLADETTEDRDARLFALVRDVVRGDSLCTFIDTSNIYSAGLSETVIGDATRGIDIRDGIVVQTKLDRNSETGDFSGKRMWNSVEESLSRLSLDRIEVLYLHDPELIGFERSMEADGPVEALVEMKRQGLASHIGISGGPVSLLDEFVKSGLFDALVTHNRYTLVDRSADDLIAHASKRGMGVTNAAPFGGGVLTGAQRFANSYGYGPAKPAVREAILGVSQVCARAGVPLAAAALQFSVRDARIHSTIVGARSVRQLNDNLSLLDVRIPESVWSEIEDLLPGPEHALDA